MNHPTSMFQLSGVHYMVCLLKGTAIPEPRTLNLQTPKGVGFGASGLGFGVSGYSQGYLKTREPPSFRNTQ